MRGSATDARHEITEWLVAWSDGEPGAREHVVSLVHEELRRMASHYLRQERRDHTLQPTALVSELYLRLARIREVSWRERAQFFALAAQLMRRILVDHARRRAFLKRGGGGDSGAPAISDEGSQTVAGCEARLLDLDRALTELARLDHFKATIVELRFFGDLTLDETAEVLGRSRPTVVRHWRLARAWLRTRLEGLAA